MIAALILEIRDLRARSRALRSALEEATHELYSVGNMLRSRGGFEAHVADMTRVEARARSVLDSTSGHVSKGANVAGRHYSQAEGCAEVKAPESESGGR